MKQVYLRPRGAFVAPPRSDTLFGLIAHAVRAVYGRASVERFLGPALEDDPQAPLYLTSAFPFLDSEKGRIHFFPTPLGDGRTTGFVEDAEFLTWLSGHAKRPDVTPLLEGLVHEDRDVAGSSRCALRRGGFFFLASGPTEHYLEAALRYLERNGFGGGASHGRSHFDVEMSETDFVRLAQPGELGILLSLCAPTAAERVAIATEARANDRVGWRVERRQGAASSAFALPVGIDASPESRQDSDRGLKAAVGMLAEGSVIPRGPGRACGSAPEVARGRDAAGEFPILQGGFGFLLPLGAEVAA